MPNIITNNLVVQGTQKEIKELVEWLRIDTTQTNLEDNLPSNDCLHHKKFIDFFRELTGIKIDGIQIDATEQERIVISMDSWNHDLRKVAIHFAQKFSKLRFVLEELRDDPSHCEFILENGKWCLLSDEIRDLDDLCTWQTFVIAAGYYDDYSETAIEKRQDFFNPDLTYFAGCERLLSEFKRATCEDPEEYDDRLAHQTVATHQWPSDATDEHESS